MDCIQPALQGKPGPFWRSLSPTAPIKDQKAETKQFVLLYWSALQYPETGQRF